MLRTRLVTAAVALPVVIWIVLGWSPAFFVGFITVLGWVALLEYFHMALPHDPIERWVGIAGGVAVAGGVGSGHPSVWGAALALMVVSGLVIALARSEDLPSAVHRLGITLLGVLYVGFFVPHMVLLREFPAGGRWWALFTTAVAMASDTGGYFVGGWIGRTKLLPTVSPSKTWEGAVGSVGGALLCAWLAYLTVFREGTFLEDSLVAVAISVFAQLGDLCESALKRAFGAKDSGWIIPGHGGILDRLDSLLFPMVFVYYYAVLVHG